MKAENAQKQRITLYSRCCEVLGSHSQKRCSAAVNPFTAVTLCQLKTTNKSAKFEILIHFFFFFELASERFLFVCLFSLVFFFFLFFCHI